MTKIISLLVLQVLFCFTFFPLSYSSNSLVETTCKQTPFFDLCVSTLESDPQSSTAAVSGLALIAAKSVNAKASATLYQISTLLGSATDPNLKKALSGCVDSYNTIIKTDIPVAVEAIEKNNPKFAVGSATDAGNEAQRCEDGFGGKSPNSPISDSNKMVHDLSVILQSIASLLL
ncbi:cell wall / vacuolar inhibitor of fructosidase 1, CELL WALL / VACUOLAR INHIBITOR OF FRUCTOSIDASE 1 [Hibiscus trionum]|uniref:Cell wall / vacuolar inhibitor of fructosidase 1, CELL WALL / VACUOLAR INHIBITOR OF FRUCTOSIDASE 1 n=1 Tax=Hibiscus trionum TaxID=183268 RepID=A0A9W7HLW1_HIBTR|nr:cell wall / vacuolar inhibitor of fructosidase 1, CELL WALL / VACUOLAR INHIBITOR OF FRUCTOSIDASE 1 [Hibiscus trionum]